MHEKKIIQVEIQEDDDKQMPTFDYVEQEKLHFTLLTIPLFTFTFLNYYPRNTFFPKLLYVIYFTPCPMNNNLWK